MKIYLLGLILLLISPFLNIEFLTSENFDERVNADDIVLVEFWAQWNNKNAYDLESLENATTYRVNVDEERALVNRFSVKNIPTVIIFKDGEPVYTESSDISFKQRTTIKDLQSVINSFRGS